MRRAIFNAALIASVVPFALVLGRLIAGVAVASYS